MLSYFGDFLGFHGGKQGSGPDRGPSPVECGDFPFVPPICSPLWAIQPGLRPSQPGTRPSQPGPRPCQLGPRPGQPGLRPSQPGLRPSQPGLRPSQPGLRLRQLARPQASGLAGWASGRTDGWTYIRRIPTACKCLFVHPSVCPSIHS